MINTRNETLRNNQRVDENLHRCKEHEEGDDVSCRNDNKNKKLVVSAVPFSRLFLFTCMIIAKFKAVRLQCLFSFNFLVQIYTWKSLQADTFLNHLLIAISIAE
jgi:hypothetical protein